MANLFTRVPNWLRDALGTTGPGLPNTLGTGAVEPVLDVYQGGWGDARIFADQITFDIGALPSAMLNICRDDHDGILYDSTPDEDHSHVVLAVGLGNGTAAAQSVNVRYGPGTLILWSSSLAAGASFAPSQFAAGMPFPWIVPPGVSLQVRIGTAGPWYLRRVIARLPAGSALL